MIVEKSSNKDDKKSLFLSISDHTIIQFDAIRIVHNKITRISTIMTI